MARIQLTNVEIETLIHALLRSTDIHNSKLIMKLEKGLIANKHDFSGKSQMSTSFRQDANNHFIDSINRALLEQAEINDEDKIKYFELTGIQL